MVSRHPPGLLAIGLVLATGPRSFAAAPPVANVQILLFQGYRVQHVQVRSAGATLQWCRTCKPQAGPVALDLRVQGPELVDAAQHSTKQLDIRGSLEVLADGLHPAEAAGIWHLDVQDGRLRVRVELSRERYTEAVLTGEADSNEPAAALQALAVTARSFAAVATGRHPGGALCDSTHCQALRLQPVAPAVHRAVWSTSGETLWLGGKHVAAYFSQHCGGFTEDASAVWGGPPLPWLTAHADRWCERVPSAWSTTLPATDVRRALFAEGFESRSPIQDIVVLTRDRSGRVLEVRVRSADRTWTMSAATLRFALNRSLGWNQLRSDRFRVVRVGDRFQFEGSGFGHGVGLCQVGCAAMARSGKPYREILAHYFPGTTVRVTASDSGWTISRRPGFLLRVTASDPALERDADAAFAAARSRWGGTTKGTPVVTVYPSIEAFRQATGRPGWELAVTDADGIATLPASVLRAHGGPVPVLRHEFLHSFVEEQASLGAPLWLREGFVEVLNGESCQQSTQPVPEDVDGALRNAGSLDQSQKAHRAACARTQRLVQQRGLAAVRALLVQR